MSADPPRQLPLALPHAPQYDADSFLVGPSNSAALALIRRWPDWPAPVVLLSGPAGSGKTHLAHVWATRSGARVMASSDLAGSTPPALAQAGLALDAVDPRHVSELDLFHLINRCKEAGASLLITSRAPAAEWRPTLPDLRSRLRLAAPATLAPPDEALLRQVLVKLFADRQLTVEKPIIDYLLTRMERSLSAAVQLVDRLDGEALAGGRPITRPLAAQVLASFESSGGPFADRQ